MLNFLQQGVETGTISGAFQQYVQQNFNIDIGTPTGLQAFTALAANQARLIAQSLKGQSV